MTTRGFTLIEMMLVIVIMGLSTSMVILVLPDQLIGHSTERQAERLGMLVSLLQEKSINEKQIFGLHVSEHSYQVMILRPSPSLLDRSVEEKKMNSLGFIWENYSQNINSLSHESCSNIELGEGDHIELRISGLSLTDHMQEPLFNEGHSDVTPQIIFFPGGEITPFTITFHLSSEPSQIRDQVSVSEIGLVHIESDSKGNL